jgi:hypothetical protein
MPLVAKSAPPVHDADAELVRFRSDQMGVIMNTQRGIARRIAAIGAAIAMVVGTLFATSLAAATPASANTPSNWSGNYQGVEFGWTNDHAWAIASYATVATLGSGEIASLACSRIGGSVAGSVCSYTVETVVSNLAAGHPRLTNHGIWIAVYPHWGYVTDQGGTY